MLARTPPPPYFAVVFTSKRTEVDSGYENMAARMVDLAQHQPGFLGLESARGADGLGITVSYWTDLASIANWKKNAEHQEAQRLGQKTWYANFKVRICRVEKDYGNL